MARVFLIKFLKAVAIVAFSAFFFLFIFFKIIDHLSRLKEPEKAKVKGEELAALKKKTVLSVVAHPDDAEWYAGGTLAQLGMNNEVVVVVATSGEKGGNHVQALGKVREKEQKKAGNILGYDDLVLLRYPDRELKLNKKQLKEELKQIFTSYKPDVLLTFDPFKPGYIYRHPDHLTVGKISIEAAKELETTKKSYLFSSNAPDVVMDVREATNKKIKALQAHRSQGDMRSRSTFLRIIFSLLRYLSFVPRTAAGANKEFPEVGIKEGEVFREVLF